MLADVICSSNDCIRNSIRCPNLGEALLGAQVFVKGTFVGTTTDDNGAFSLDIESGATLVVNYIGYKSQEVSVAEGQALLSVLLLEPDVLKQDEVVVTGLASSVKDLI